MSSFSFLIASLGTASASVSAACVSLSLSCSTAYCAWNCVRSVTSALLPRITLSEVVARCCVSCVTFSCSVCAAALRRRFSDAMASMPPEAVAEAIAAAGRPGPMPLAVVAFCALDGITSPLKVNLLCSLVANLGSVLSGGSVGLVALGAAVVAVAPPPPPKPPPGAPWWSGRAPPGAGMPTPSAAALASKNVRRLNRELSATSAWAGRRDIVPSIMLLSRKRLWFNPPSPPP